jgi:dienelactone hydrolase
MRQRVAVLVALVVACSGFTAASRAQGQDVEKTWEAAQVYLPGKVFASAPGGIQESKPLPVVIYMHGCTGIDPRHDVRWADFIKSLGFAVVLPDSMARPGRKPNCDPRTKSGGAFPQAHAMRQEEIAYALEQLRKAPWADARNIYLMGHSEGGQAAARCRLGGLRGVIISGWTCTHARNPVFDGIHVPVETPILAMAFDRDAWRAGNPTEGSCASKFGDRPAARQLIFQGSDHGTYEQREARDAVAKFLKDNRLE